MGKKSKKRKAERKAKRVDWAQELRERKVTQLEQKITLIPPGVATSEELDDLLREDKLRLIFTSYNHKECELASFSNVKQTKALVRLLDKVTWQSIKSFPSSGIARDNVYNQGAYQSLYNNLSPDIELKEAGFFGTGRVFFFLIENLFFIVAITMRHKN